MSGFKPVVLTGDQEDAVDSIVDLPDDSIPKAESGQLVRSSTTEDSTTKQFMFEKSINIINPTKPIELGNAWTLSASGASISATDDAIDMKYRIHIDDMDAIDQPTIIANRLLTGEFAVQPIDADTLVDPVDAMVVIPAVAPLLSLGPAEDGQVITGVDLKLTAASVKTNITITLTLNSVIFAQFFFPVAILKTGPDIYHFDYDPPVDVRVGDTLLVNTSSTDGAMIFLGRADTQVKWQQVNLILWDDVIVPTKEDIPSIADKYVRINDQYTSFSAQTSGFVIGYLPIIKDEGFDFLSSISTAGITSGVCTTVSSGTFSQGDLIQVSGSRFNDDIFEVENHTGNLLEIRGFEGISTVEDFTREDFQFETEAATITKKEFSVMRAGVDGEWEYGKGSVTGIEFSKVGVENAEIERLLIATSLASNQDPSGTGPANSIQIEFGVAQFGPTDPVELDIDGTLTFNEAGLYRIKIAAQIGRSGAGGVSQLLLRGLINGIQEGRTVAFKVDNANVIIPYADEIWLNVPAATVFKYEIMRDSSGMDSGGLVGQDVTVELDSWSQDLCAELRIERWIS